MGAHQPPTYQDIHDMTKKITIVPATAVIPKVSVPSNNLTSSVSEENETITPAKAEEEGLPWMKIINVLLIVGAIGFGIKYYLENY